MDSIHVNPPLHRSNPETNNSSEQSYFCGKVVCVIEAAIRLVQDVKEKVYGFFINLKKIITRHCFVCCRDDNISETGMTADGLHSDENVGVGPQDIHVTDNHSSSIPPISTEAVNSDAEIVNSPSPEEHIEAMSADSSSLTSQHASLTWDVTEPAISFRSDQPPQIYSDSGAIPKFTLHDMVNACSLPTEEQCEKENSCNGAACVADHDRLDTVDTLATESLAPECIGPNAPSDSISTGCLLIDTEPSIPERFQELDKIIMQKMEEDPALQKYDEHGPLTFRHIVRIGDFELVWKLMTDYPEHFEQPQGLLYLLFNTGLQNRLRDSYEEINFDNLTLIVDNLLLTESHTTIVDTLICITALMKACEEMRPERETDQCKQHIFKTLTRYKIQITQYLAKNNHSPNVQMMRRIGMMHPLTQHTYRLHSRPFLLSIAMFNFPQIGQITIEAHMLSRLIDTSSPVSEYQFLYDDLIDCIYSSFIKDCIFGYAEHAWIAYLEKHYDVKNAIIIHAIKIKNEAHILQLQQAGILYKESTNPLIEERIRAITDQTLLQAHATQFNIKVVRSAQPDTPQKRLTWMPDAPEKPDHIDHLSIEHSADTVDIPTNTNKSDHSIDEHNEETNNNSHHHANLSATCPNSADLPLTDSTLSKTHSESTISYSVLPKQLTPPCIFVDSESSLTEAFQALDATMAQDHIMLSSAFEAYALDAPLTFSYTVIAADFALVWELMTQYPSHFAQKQGILHCLFLLGLANPKRYYFDEIDFEKLTLIIQKLVLSEPNSVLIDTLLCIYYLIEKVDTTKNQSRIHYQEDLRFLEKMEEYKVDIINTLIKREAIAIDEIPIEAYMLQRALKSIKYTYRFKHLCKHYFLDKLYDHCQDNFNEAWMEFIRGNNEIGTALILAAIKRMDESMLDYIEKTGFQCGEFPVALLPQLTKELAHTLVHKAAITFDLRINKRLLRARLREKIDFRVPISKDAQQNYQILTGEPFDEDDIFDDEEYRYDHAIVLATPSVIDDGPEKLCIKHPRRTALYEWSINDERLKLIRGIERPLKGNYKIIIGSHGDGNIISDKDKYGLTELPLGGQYVANKMHQLIMKKDGDKPSKITLLHCNTGSNLPLINFRTRFTKRLAFLGYRTMVSAPRIGCPSFSDKTGRKTYIKEGLLGLTIELPWIKKALSYWNEVQTKDKETHDHFIGTGYKRVNNMKAIYRIEDGNVIEEDDSDLPELK
ncbi:C80 family cysteine peptidase [Kistimonas asteriae]|uniref:C80 family cysteine peptidase n=1 Tax=Kistimonas asteriae TaxID=517724 RepID=UPI001BA81F9B|nr:C80 family cysteine peptidase [Kistimonas asteriae]